MVAKFTDEEIRRHLAELGYTNIPAERLRVFAKDLRRLMKYEERKKQLASELDNLENKSPPHKNIRCVAFFQNIFQ
jgi:hypothetical protein